MPPPRHQKKDTKQNGAPPDRFWSFVKVGIAVLILSVIARSGYNLLLSSGLFLDELDRRAAAAAPATPFEPLPSFELEPLVDIALMDERFRGDENTQRFTAAITDLTGRLKQRLESYEGQPAETILDKDPFILRIFSLVNPIVLDPILREATPFSASCDSESRNALVDLCLVLADLWFALDRDASHEAVLAAAVDILRPQRALADANATSLPKTCETRRATILEELIVLQPNSMTYRNQYAACLILALRRYDEGIAFLSKYPKRLQVVEGGKHTTSEKLNAAKERARWSVPLTAYAKKQLGDSTAGASEACKTMGELKITPSSGLSISDVKELGKGLCVDTS